MRMALEAQGQPMLKRLLQPKVLALLTIVVLAFIFTNNVHTWFDLTLSGDTDYIYDGLHFPQQLTGEMPGWAPEWGPLYHLWFFALSKLTPDSTKIFYLSLRLVGMLLPILIYLVLERTRVAPLVAVGVASLFLASYANWIPEPRVMNFALLIMLLVWWGTSFFVKRWKRLLALAVFSLFVAYVRPEFFPVTVLLGAVALVYLAFSLLKQKLQLATWDKVFTGGMAGVFTLFLFWWGVPFNGQRTIYAFGQHYARNVKYCFGEDVPAGTPWEEILARDFGEPTNLFQAISQNPRAFEKHVFCNISNFPKQFLSITFTSSWGNSWFLIKLVLAVLLWRLIFHWRAIRSRLQWLWEKDLMLLGLVCLIPATLDVTIIYPREHYIVLSSLLVLVLGTMAISGHEVDGNKQLAWKQTLAGCLLLILLFPSMGALFDNKPPEKPVLETVQEIRSLNSEEPIRMFATHPFQVTFAKVYFADDFVPILYKPLDVGFEDYLVEQQPNLLLITEGGKEFGNDPTWEEFQSAPQSYGFTEITLQGGDLWGPWRIYLKKELLN
jgi:hypothetical protein